MLVAPVALVGPIVILFLDVQAVPFHSSVAVDTEPLIAKAAV